MSGAPRGWQLCVCVWVKTGTAHHFLALILPTQSCKGVQAHNHSPSHLVNESLAAVAGCAAGAPLTQSLRRFVNRWEGGFQHWPTLLQR